MKKRLLVGILLLSSLSVLVGCNNNDNTSKTNSNQVKQQNTKNNNIDKKELSNKVIWDDTKGNFGAEVIVNKIREFTPKDKLYNCIKENNNDKDLYLVDYTYKNGDIEDKLEINLTNFKFYTPDGELLETLANGADSFKGEISKNKSATTNFLISVPKGTKLNSVTFEVGNSIFPDLEGKIDISK